MIRLPNVTLVCVATRDHMVAVEALRKSCLGIEWGAVKLVSDIIPLNIPANCSHVHIDRFDDIDDWNYYIVYKLHMVIDTEFCMLIHPDGYVTSPTSWKDEFLDYDYIGAPWIENKCFIADTGELVRVGNSVSIRSKKLLELPSKLGLMWEYHDGNRNEDSFICVHNRSHFLNAGCTFAPIDIAKYFSHEVPVPEIVGITPFAFHEYEPPFPKFSMTDVYTGYVNLDSRPDRNTHMQQELSRVGISAIRHRGLLPEEVGQPESKLKVMLGRTRGAVGCHYSQVQIMETALANNQHALVMEDDLIFCDDIQQRLLHVEQFLSIHEWDIMWLGGTYHKEPTWHKSVNGQHTHPDLQMCTCDLNRDWELTDNPQIVRTYGCWSTYAYIVNRKRLAHILDLLDQNVYRSQGIDWLFILLQPQLYTYAYNPGCVKQYDNVSNIGNGITRFSVFESLGSHWYKQQL